MTQRTSRSLLLAAGLLLLAGCSDPAGPPLVSGDQLLFIRQHPSAPPLAANEVSFVATYGESADVRLPYSNGHECLRFRLDDESLQARPNGTVFRPGDTVTITIRLVDPTQYHFEFQPAGLRFSSSRPAELRVSYRYSDPDVDGDGDVDDQDRVRFEGAAFWRQETVGASWMRIGTARVDATEEMRAELRGFTRYALASN